MHFVDAKGILSAKNGMNIYRGCTHGCIYCDSRSDCYQMHHAFEDIEVKQNCVELLEKALQSKRKKCMIGTGSMADPYMHCEEKLELMKKCLEVIERYGFGATVITKSDCILRDLPLFSKINQKAKAVVQTTLTTYDEDLCKILEPNVCTTKKRFEMLMAMKEEKIPTVVWMSPILPFINDTKENLDGLLDYCIKAEVKGIICFGIGMTLRNGNREYFYQKLDEHFPGLKQKYQQIYGNSYEVGSLNGRALYRKFQDTCKAHNILCTPEEVFAYINEFPYDKGYEQLSLFDV
jgi:DNA repair photolyase